MREPRSVMRHELRLPRLTFHRRDKNLFQDGHSIFQVLHDLLHILRIDFPGIRSVK